MKILIVEDDENKRSQLNSFIEANFPELTVVNAFSIQKGLDHVFDDKIDLIVLDMTLPTYDVTPDEPGGGTNIYGGCDFLSQLDRFDIKTPAIVVTQFEIFGSGSRTMTLEGLRDLLKKEHADNCYGLVYYNASSETWIGELDSLLKSLLEIQGLGEGK
ncbi:response regulator [Pseudomonas brassicacearum]|uniref:response regulator n=1 Tax=Pseudomonas brassicacearum TaxID=930166 RepID=UPI0009B88FC1|nr:response regulator [Pseudomonas brassicacearum]